MNLNSELVKFVNRDIITVYIIFLITGISSSFIIPLLADLDIYYGPFRINILDYKIFLSLSTIEAVFIAVATISLIFWGYIIDKYARKKYLLLGVANLILGLTIILIDLNNIGNYFLGRSIFMGIGVGALGPVAYSYAGDVISINERSKISGGISVVILVSSGIGILLSVLLTSYNLFYPFQCLFIVLSFLLLILMLYSEPVRGREEPEVKKLYKTENVSNIQLRDLNKRYTNNITFLTIFSLFRRRTNIFMFLQGIFALIPSVIFTYYIISYIRDSRYGGLNFPLELAMILALTPSSGRIFGYLIFGIVGDWLHNKKNSRFEKRGRIVVAGVTMLLQAPIMIIAFSFNLPNYIDSDSLLQIVVSPPFLLFGVVFFIGAFIGGGSGPNRRSITYDINEPELRGQASSLFSIGDSLGASLGLFIGNLLIISNGYNFAFQILSLFYFVAGFLWLGALFTIIKDEDELRANMQKRTQLYNNL